MNSLKRPALPLLFLLAGAGCQSAGEQPARAVQSYSIQDFLNTRNFVGASFSPDNSKLLVSSDQSGVYNAYAIPVEGGEPVPLTQSTADAVFVLDYFPEDERFLYTSDQGGNELNHVFVRELDGSSKDLTPGEGLKAVFYGWAHDDLSFLIGTNERDRRFFDVYEYGVNDYQRKMIFSNDLGHNFSDMSRDRRYLALSKLESNSDSDIYLYDRVQRKMTHVTPHQDDVLNSPEMFSPDGSSLYYLTDQDSEFQYLVRYDLESRERSTVETAEWDILYAYFSKRGKYLVIGVNADARTELRVYEAKTKTPVSLPDLPEAEITSVSLSRDEQRMAFYASASRLPRDLFYYDFSGHQPRQLTRSLNPGIDPRDLVEARVVRFPSYDGLEIPGILYQPHQAESGEKLPALVWVHGGPGGQSRVGYSALLQYLVNHGYVIYAINNRGSSGYGKGFVQMDDRKHGESDLDDCVASKQMLVETGYVDGQRIGIIGGSYGGYMVLAALAFRPEEFALGVDIFGISNWHRTVQSIPPWWESIRKALEEEMGDFDDEEYFRTISPLFHARNIVKPLMVLQGANDPRVLKVESDEIVEAVRANGVPVEYVVFEDEGHGFLKKENRERGYEAILKFLDRYLKGAGETGTGERRNHDASARG